MMSGIYEMDEDELSDEEFLNQSPPTGILRFTQHNQSPAVIPPETGRKSKNEGTPASSESSQDPSSQQFSLEKLLTQHKERVRVEKEVDEIRTLLQGDIENGGFINVINNDDEISEPETPAEHAMLLQQFHLHESQMCRNRPGVHVFHCERYLCNFDVTLHPCHCGFRNVNDSEIEKHIHSLEAYEYKNLLTKGVIPHCLEQIACREEFMRWMFLILSVYDDIETLTDLVNTMIEIVHREPVWGPNVSDILSILVNYGASEEELLGNCENHSSYRSKGLVQPNYKPKTKDSSSNGFSLENLEAVLQVLAEALTYTMNNYSGLELNTLLHAVCMISLDVKLGNMTMFGTVQQCAAAILEHYTEVDWRQQRLCLSRMLGTMCTNAHKAHINAHNKAHIAELILPTERGFYLHRGMGYIMLHDILGTSQMVTDEELSNLEIQDLIPFVDCIDDLLKTDPYLLSSVIAILGKCVGPNISLSPHEQEQLKSLMEKIKCIRVNDDLGVLDRTVVKDMIARLTSRWNLDIQAGQSKQMRLFQSSSPAKQMKITKVQSLRPASDSEDEMEPEMTESL